MAPKRGRGAVRKASTQSSPDALSTSRRHANWLGRQGGVRQQRRARSVRAVPCGTPGGRPISKSPADRPPAGLPGSEASPDAHRHRPAEGSSRCLVFVSCPRHLQKNGHRHRRPRALNVPARAADVEFLRRLGAKSHKISDAFTQAAALMRPRAPTARPAGRSSPTSSRGREIEPDELGRTATTLGTGDSQIPISDMGAMASRQLDQSTANETRPETASMSTTRG